MSYGAIRSEQPFDLCGPLPTGVTVLEASAGTGKTYTIAALAARFIADGMPLHQLLLVTFTRMATGELRERVRDRLVRTEQELSRVVDGVALSDSADEVTALLGSGPVEAVELRRDRLAAAISNFDAATIATTHSFCRDVLAELGTLGDLEPDVRFAEDIDDLIEEVIDDLYIRRFWRDGNVPIGREQAGQIARLAIGHPTAVIHPSSEGDGVAAMRSRLAQAARKELEARKRARGVMTYDDLLTRLRGTLLGRQGAAATARLRERYRVVLIDEFQDTDPVQWEIVQRAFDAHGLTLVLIADPKQAIYAFRGADVYAYLAAARTARSRATLDVNRRSDQALIDAYDALFGGAALGHPEIVYRKVRAAAANHRSRLIDAGSRATLRIRLVDREQPSIELTAARFASAQSAREHVAYDVAADITELLSSQTKIEHRSESGERLRRDKIAPGHIAVLVQTHRNAALIQRELEAASVPAVINGAGSVFATEAAQDWLVLLAALERPASPPRARSAALTPFLGWSAAQVACATEDELEDLHQKLHGWARLLRLRGVAALRETISFGEQLPARLLGRADGERLLTDLEHVSQVLHAAASDGQLGTTALSGWLRQRIAAAAREGDNDELTRRLESDADAVQVLTIHRSKGLEFPIVYCPFLWEPRWIPDDARPVYFHEEDEAEVARAIDVGLEGRDFETHQLRYIRDERGEDLRLMYVALTRAKHQAVIWWAPSYDSRNSPLSRLVFEQDAHGNVATGGRRVPSDQDAFVHFSQLGAQTPGLVRTEWSRLGEQAHWKPPPAKPATLEVAAFDRTLDMRWRRTSYTDLTAAAHEAWVASEPEERAVLDEPAAAEEIVAGGPLPLAGAPVGARFGTFVHRVLEAAAFDGPDLEGELAAKVAALAGRSDIEIGSREQLCSGLAAALRTPLGGSLGAIGLTDVARRDRLDELEFELPLAGGDDPSGQVALDAVADVLRRRLAADDPLAAYAERLGDPLLRGAVRGYLTGSIDLVLRVEGRFAVIDYKTNWLGGPDQELTAAHYRPAALAAEMQRSHYALQALLYQAALHRYLRWRLPGYRAESDLAGVRYLFLRGMLGPSETPTGVFVWEPPGAMIEELSDVLGD
jgi:exodeoxyribonuclease V beta subunit